MNFIGLSHVLPTILFETVLLLTENPFNKTYTAHLYV